MHMNFKHNGTNSFIMVLVHYILTLTQDEAFKFLDNGTITALKIDSSAVGT